MSVRKIKIEIEKMSISEVDKILFKKYKISRRKNYPEDIKRTLLFDLETKVSERVD
jgi:hypothetical protein